MVKSVARKRRGSSASTSWGSRRGATGTLVLLLPCRLNCTRPSATILSSIIPSAVEKPADSATGCPISRVMAFDPLVSNAGRLAILAVLARETSGPADFVAVRRETRLTDGNLSAHARRLHSAGLIDIQKR